MNNNIEKYEIDKKEFLELYEKAKKDKVDLNSLPPETLKKMCILLEEEIKIKQKRIDTIKAKLNAI